MTSAIPAATIAAYQDAHYAVDATPPFVMRIGMRCEALAALGSTGSAFITACNPLGETLDDASNALRQQALARTLTERALRWVTGAGRDPAQAWPAEPSFLVLNVSLEEAMALARAQQQNAIVWCGPDKVPQLILLR